MRYLLILSAITLLFACNNIQNEENEAEKEQEVSVKEEDPKPKEGNWDEFWSEFQNAVVNGDKKAVKQLTHFGGITEAELEDIYESFFGGEYKAYFEKGTAADAKANESTFDGVEASDIMRFEVYESGEDEEGNEYESGVSYYFGKVAGSYKLVYIVAAG